MSNQYAGGFISKTPPTVTTSSAQGMWTLSQQAQYQKEGVWPVYELHWISILGVSGQSSDAGNIKLDSSGNVYISGNNSYIYPSVSILAEYSPTATLSFQKAYNFSTYYGNMAWVNNDNTSDFYLCGNYWHSNHTAPHIIKLNSSGVLQWEAGLDSGGYSSFYACSVDSSGNVYAVGQASISGNNPAIIVKYNSSGTIQWQKQTGYATVSCQSCLVDSSGDLIVCGTGAGYSGAYLFKVFSTGASVSWVNTISNGSTPVIGLCVASDSSNNIYFCGGTDYDSPNKANIFKVDSSGAYLWKKSLTNASGSTFRGVAVDSANNVYVCGNASISGRSNGIIAKYNSSGTIQWQRYLDDGRGVVFSKIKISGSKIYVTGTSAPVSGTQYQLTCVLATDGSLSGTYTIGSYTYTYGASSLTDGASSLSLSSSSLSLSNAGMTSDSQTVTENTSTLTSTVTLI